MATTYNKYFIRTYCPIEFIRDILAEHDSEIKAHAFIEHNKDACEWHRHTVLWLERSKSKKTIENWFSFYRDINGKPVQTRVECTKLCKKADGTTETQTVDLKGATFYLVHEDKDGNPLPNKYHYSWDEVESKNLDLLKGYEYGKTNTKHEDKSFEILEEVLAGENPYILAKKYGRDYILNYRKYVDLATTALSFNTELQNREEMARKRKEEEEKQAFLTALGEDVYEPTLQAQLESYDTENERLRALLRANGIDADSGKEIV